MTFARKSRVAAALALALGMSSAAVAQETSSAMRGKIVGPQGNPAANTKITIIHQPSGTVKEFTTNESGAFNAKGLRVGGPYTVIVDSEVFRDKVEEGISLNLGETYRLNVQLADANADMERIVVTGSVPLFTSSGSSSSYGATDVFNAASIGRDIKDIVRSNPLVSIMPNGEMTVAGMNPRFNSITVDGIGQNDDFGLNSGGYPTNRSPIPFEALDQVSVDVAPFNAKASGFSGALVNANFKSGTNEFKGGVYFEKVPKGLTGTPTRRNSDGELEDVDIDLGGDETYGFSLGGPILKDKLFFFTTYEKFELPSPIEYGPAGSGLGNDTDVSIADVDAVRAIASDVYGIDDIGGWEGQSGEEDEKLVFKIDWNINDFHRAAFTYQYNKGNEIRNMTSGTGELKLNSAWYDNEQTLNNISAKLYSDWSDDFSTEFSITNKKHEQVSSTFSNYADITIKNLNVDGDSNEGNIALGADKSRHANQLENEKLQIKLDAEYLLGDHSLGFGVTYTDLDIYNLFIQNAKGTVEFNSLEDFRNQNAARYTYQNGVGNDIDTGAADFSRQSLEFYIQDTWDLTEDLTLNYGVRYERYGSSDKPLYNEKSFARTGYDNSENLDGIDIILPRLGFKWYINEDLTLRGGVGRFSGGQPNVWISNAYSNSGVNTGFFQSRNVEVPTNIFTDILPAASTALNNADSDGAVNLNDPNFELPSDWRYQLAADVTFDIPYLGEDFAWSTEILYIEKKDAAYWVDASLSDDDLSGTAAGGLKLYNDTDSQYDLMLTNADNSGRSVILSTTLAKSWDNGVNFNASYTNQDITEANPGTSSTAQSNFRYNTAINRDVPFVGTAAYEVEHRFTLNLGYSTEFFEGYKTSFNLFFERRSGKPYSHIMNWGDVGQNIEDFNINTEVDEPWDMLSPGFSAGNYLAYVPTANDPNVVYLDTYDEDTGEIVKSAAELEAEVLAAVEARGLSQYAGGYADKGTSRTPWVNTLDLNISQEIPGFMEGHKGTVYLIVDNLLNLIDSSQGKVYTNTFNTSRLYRGTIDPETQKFVVEYVNNDQLNFESEESTWRVKLGIRYDF